MSYAETRFRKTRLMGVLAATCMLGLFPATAQEGATLVDTVPSASIGSAAESVKVAQARQVTRSTRKRTRDAEAIPSQARRSFEAAIGDLTGGRGTAAALPHPDNICAEWFVSWVDDGEGGYVPGTVELYCDGTTIPLA